LIKAANFQLFFFLIGSYLLQSCQRELTCAICPAKNLPPVAKAGHEQFIILPTDSVLFDGSESYDIDGNIAAYKWKYISGPDNYSILSPLQNKTVVKGLALGIYNFELTVTDNGGLSAADTVVVTVDKSFVNHPPVAVAGNDTTLILPNQSILLDGSKSWDPDNNIIGYAWRKITGSSEITLADPASQKFQVDHLVEGVFSFELTVTDAEGLFDKDTIVVTVNPSPNKAPIAKAGPDQSIYYNLQTCSMEPSFITLDGSSSYDVDGTIISYKWSLIMSDNYSVIISNPNEPVTTVVNITPGSYAFQLSVTDNNGASSVDTLIITTSTINRSTVFAQLISVGSLSEKRQQGAVVAVGNKLFFAGGTTPPVSPGPHPTSMVDIYDVSTNTWSTAQLSQARWGLTAVAMGNKVYFAGGTAQSGTGVKLTSRMDIYDLANDTWSTMELPKPGWYSSIATNNALYFAGGNAIDIFNFSTKTWTSKTLSQPRYQIAVSNMQGKLFFAGGSSTTSGGTAYSTVDYYDPNSNAWFQEQLSKPKYGIAAIGMRGQNIWAGGKSGANMLNEVEIRLDAGNKFACLFQSNAFGQYSVARAGNNIVFFVWSGVVKNKFDIYDALNDKWSIGLLDRVVSPSYVITVNN
jgi:hypothetical protein